MNPQAQEDPKTKPGTMMSSILRQELVNYTPQCNIKCSIFCNIIMMVLFLGLGLPILLLTSTVKEFIIDYSDWYDYFKLVN
jgi:hypothetical protein